MATVVGTAALVAACMADVAQPATAVAETERMAPITMETIAPKEPESQENIEVLGLFTADSFKEANLQLFEEAFLEEPVTEKIEFEATAENEKTNEENEEIWQARLKAKREEWQKEIERQKAEARRIAEERRRARIRARKLARARARARAKAEEQKRQNAQQQLFAEVTGEETLLAKVIELEAGNSTKTDMIGVGSVVLNRLRSTYSNFRYHHTIADVVYSPGQYGCLDGIPSCEPSETAKDVAHGLLYGQIPIWPEKVLYQTTYRQSWMDGLVGTYEVANVSEYYGYPLDFEEGCK